jgi:hypothetical protein
MPLISFPAKRHADVTFSRSPALLPLPAATAQLEPIAGLRPTRRRREAG